MPINIRKVTQNDVATLIAISRQTFTETFAAQNTAEDMADYLEKSFSRERLSAEIKDASSEFYFAYLDQRLCGYMKINFDSAQTEVKDKASTEIERIYVLKDCQGKGIGQHLLDLALKLAHDASKMYVWLGVWEKNIQAISFYKKNGFKEFDRHVFRVGNDEQTDIMMRRRLR